MLLKEFEKRENSFANKVNTKLSEKEEMQEKVLRKTSQRCAVCFFLQTLIVVWQLKKIFLYSTSFFEHCSSAHYCFVDFIRPGETEKPMFLPAHATNAALCSKHLRNLHFHVRTPARITCSLRRSV